MKLVAGLACMFSLCCLALAGKAQAVPDSSVSSAIPDSVAVKRRASATGGNTVVISKTTPLTDTSKGKRLPFQPNPKKSGLYSAILPGAGQAYNRQYWKMPIIYAGMAASGYFLIFNSDQYTRYRNAYTRRIDGDPTTVDDYVNIYTTDGLKQLRDGYKKYLDMTVLLTTLGYAIQVMDAVTYAHLHNFDVSRDITLRLSPIVQPAYVGLGIVMRLK